MKFEGIRAFFVGRPTQPTLPSAGKSTATQAYVQELLQENERLRVQLYETNELLADRTRQLRRINIENIRRDALIAMLLCLIEPLEDVQRAMHLSNVPRTVKQTNWMKGLVAAHNKLMRAFRAQGVSTFGLVNETFDPTRHEALTLAYREDIPEDTIAVVYQSGYSFRGMTISPAKVCVSTLRIEQTA